MSRPKLQRSIDVLKPVTKICSHIITNSRPLFCPIDSVLCLIETFQFHEVPFINYQSYFDFKLALPNSYPIDDLLEHMKGLVLQNHSHRSSMTRGNSRISGKRFDFDKLFESCVVNKSVRSAGQERDPSAFQHFLGLKTENHFCRQTETDFHMSPVVSSVTATEQEELSALVTRDQQETQEDCPGRL
ncbi:hypothetical protein STEG23_011750 [Scotinomys teguina]